jgi:hypothetical protein
VVPLGEKVSDALRLLSAEERIDPSRCLTGFPHPSGNNGHRMHKWSQNRRALKRQTAAWFEDHPVVA